MKKLFSGIHTINLDDSGKFINEMCSTDGEIVRLLTPIDINHPVEVIIKFPHNLLMLMNIIAGMVECSRI